ncbi:putative virulence protein VrlC.2 [Wolbachia endosymbiont of Armadillidium vulgare str. wVulC]|nr:putative virulence protein VrlC.2 [Wolbachia endosymbiont of Armadillidium vulgare str. wVulC]
MQQEELAQTFTPNESRHIGGVEIWFTNSGKKRVVVQIRATAVGMPSQTVIAESYIEPKDIKIDGTATRITWSPVWCEAGREYAIVLLTDDADTAVKVAELGKYDAVNSRWVAISSGSITFIEQCKYLDSTSKFRFNVSTTSCKI